MNSSLWFVVGIFLLILLLAFGSYRLHRRGRLDRYPRADPIHPVNADTGRPPLPSDSDSDRDDLTYRINVHGRERTFTVHIPVSYPSSRKLPVLFVFHGGGRGSARGIARRAGFNRLADSYGFIVLYPTGYRSSWNDGRGTTDAEREGIDDIAFVRRIIDELEGRFAIDHKRMYAVGSSNGGMFVNRLGCELSDRFAGIAFVIGPMPAPIARRCEPQKPISVLGIFGTADPLIPWRGGEVQGGARGFILGAEETIELWARSNGCLARRKTEVLPSQVDDGTVVKRTVYHGCKEGREVVLYAIEGGGHVWPPARPTSWRAGKSSQNLDASQVIWSFFASQPPR